ncbi:YaaL family protein [Limosilactobacillus sp.]|uniref:YaaL family protein n=1 Tax=Limosilactobacillus sp. TaxID=2773925 RepID=UPI0035A166C4
MLFKHTKHAVERERNEHLLATIYSVKASWDHARETERAVYEANINTELHDRAHLQEQKYLYLYRLARKYHVHGQLNQGVVSR